MKIKIFKQKICIIMFIIFIFDVTAVSDKKYIRIVSLAPSVTSSLYSLGEEHCVKGITIYCPKGLYKKEIIGTLLEFDIEKISLLSPDLIISDKECNNKMIIEKLKRLGFEVYVVEIANSFNDICKNYLNLAKKLGKVKSATKIISISKYLVEMVYTKLNALKPTTIFFEVGINPLYTVGNKSFINEYNHYLKTINVYHDIKLRYFPVSIEDVINRNPNIILLINDKYINIKEKRKWEKYKIINAVKNKKVFMIDTCILLEPTPLKFAKGLIILEKIIYDKILNLNE
ncbi:MAG: helical backbone metal receptor [Endomicrobium sp.]|jgi:iron complex transport system substrate-binding protein|nr:helical backbone metal receptor [Endomicrobium sp.]